jgi:hypothetical protein
MDSKLPMNYRHFTKAIEHDTKVVHLRAITYGSYDEDTTALILALTGLGLLAIATLTMLFSFSVL